MLNAANLAAAGNAPPIPAAAQNLAIMNGPYVGIKAAITIEFMQHNKFFFFKYCICISQITIYAYCLTGKYRTHSQTTKQRFSSTSSASQTTPYQSTNTQSQKCDVTQPILLVVQYTKFNFGRWHYIKYGIDLYGMTG